MLYLIFNPILIESEDDKELSKCLSILKNQLKLLKKNEIYELSNTRITRKPIDYKTTKNLVSCDKVMNS
jgi:hypothetical protein